LTVVRILIVISAVAAVLAAAPTAGAAIVVKKDLEGRPITFDTRTRGVDVNWYARTLRRAIHGSEISTVTFRIVAPKRLAALCGKGAAACYKRDRSGARIVLPKGRSAFLATTMYHEYGHNVDLHLRVRGVPEMNGSERWFAARNMATRLQNGRVAIGYSLGWSRSVGEIFAEDYARIHATFRWNIKWIGPPSAAVRHALRQDLAEGLR
jgi:hypothetical protein